RQLAPAVGENDLGARLVPRSHPSCDVCSFANEQIQQLIHRIFFPGAPKPLRQIVIAGFDQQSASASICTHLVRTMAVHLPGTVCAVDADLERHELEALLDGDTGSTTELAPLRHHNLWVVPSSGFLAPDNGSIALNAQSRMSALRRKFDYVVVHAPGGDSSLLPLLGQFADGVILVAQAHVTRRKAAVKVR